MQSQQGGGEGEAGEGWTQVVVLEAELLQVTQAGEAVQAAEMIGVGEQHLQDKVVGVVEIVVG